MPASPISKTPTSSVEPNRFFVARSEPERGVALALEGEHRVDEVLERLRPGERAVLRDVPDEDDRDPLPLGELHQPQGGLADLADAPGRPSSSSTVAVWMESTTRSWGRSSGAISAIRPTRASATTRIPSPPGPSSRPSRAARSRTWAADSSPVA